VRHGRAANADAPIAAIRIDPLQSFQFDPLLPVAALAGCGFGPCWRAVAPVTLAE